MSGHADVFEAHRPRLFGVAWRMLRSRSDAEDLLQDVYLRRHDSYSTSIQSAVAFLITITTRLCLDRIQERKRERAGEVERSLSVLSVDEHIPSPETQRELSEEVSVAILAVLERLGPEERTAFLLREVFDYDYSESAQILGKAEAACRQMIRRARAQVRESSPRFRVTAESRERMLGRFRVAASSGDRQAVMALLTEEVEYVAEPASGGTKNAEVRRSSYVIGRTARPSCGHLVSQTIARESSRPPGASALVLDEEHDELRQRMWGPSDTAHPGAGVSTPAWCGAWFGPNPTSGQYSQMAGTQRKTSPASATRAYGNDT